MMMVTDDLSWRSFAELIFSGSHTFWPKFPLTIVIITIYFVFYVRILSIYLCPTGTNVSSVVVFVCLHFHRYCITRSSVDVQYCMRCNKQIQFTRFVATALCPIRPPNVPDVCEIRQTPLAYCLLASNSSVDLKFNSLAFPLHPNRSMHIAHTKIPFFAIRYRCTVHTLACVICARVCTVCA